MTAVLFAALDAEGWTAIATWITAAIAGAATLFAFFQLRHAKDLRDEQAAPYVVVYAMPSIPSERFFDVVVKNMGKTAARDVRVDFRPVMRRYARDGEEIAVPEIPVLVPGQEYRFSGTRDTLARTSETFRHDT